MTINITLLTFVIGVVYAFIAFALFSMSKTRGYSTTTRWLLTVVGLIPGINIVTLIVVYFMPPRKV